MTSTTVNRIVKLTDLKISPSRGNNSSLDLGMLQLIHVMLIIILFKCIKDLINHQIKGTFSFK